MKADEIQTSANLSGGVVLLVGAVLQEHAQKLSGFRTGRASRIGPANTGFGQGAKNGVDAEVIELEKLFRSSLPIVDVRFVPNLPKPRFDFGIAITGAEVLDELEDKVRPLLIVLRRMRPSRVDGTLRKTVPVRIWVSG